MTRAVRSYPPGVRQALQRAREIMVSITTAFIVHGVVGFIFCLPVFMMGLRGFIDVGPPPAGAAACDAPPVPCAPQAQGHHTMQHTSSLSLPAPPPRLHRRLHRRSHRESRVLLSRYR